MVILYALANRIVILVPASLFLVRLNRSTFFWTTGTDFPSSFAWQLQAVNMRNNNKHFATT